MNCRRAEIALSRQLDGDLSPREQLWLESHLAACPACRRTAAEWAGIRSALREAGPSETPDPARAWQSIRRSIHQSGSLRRPPLLRRWWRPPLLRRWWRTPLPWAGLAAATILALVVLIRPGGPGSVPTDNRPPVEFVETGLGGAATVVYIDDESGWSIVWVAEPLPEANSAG